VNSNNPPHKSTLNPQLITRDFYQHLPIIDSFEQATLAANHTDVPPDWWIVIADVIGSTQAIVNGQYKAVNTLGVACIAAVINVDRNVEIPYIFGGDGATFAVPEIMLQKVENALRGAQLLAQQSFGLGLRVGLVRVAELNAEQFYVRLGKLKLSPHITQPVFSGRGWDEAERRVKTPSAMRVRHLDASDGLAEASFEGFECRWQNVPSFNGHKLALLVCATAKDAASNFAIYKQVLAQIQAIYGQVENYHPLQAQKMRLTFNPQLLKHEWRVRSAQFSIGQRLGYLGKMLFQNAAGKYIFAKNIDTKETKWSSYRDELVDNSDFRKFDGVLRMVIDGSDAQAHDLQAYLDAQHAAGNLVYGMHKSREALLTCIVQSYNGKHMHFVDGSDGGYALAARGLKAQIAKL
jgi:Protein of unknown function (DUF3095)